jgi:4-amino-4-deoxy-L-arabinose transferase-like glycosyltransferase
MHYFTSRTVLNNQIIFYSVCIFFILLNFFTIDWFPLPWCDEVIFHDGSVNFALTGEWRTTAWGADKDNEIYISYPPLYQFLLIPWIYLFGLSPLACRSLNVVLGFLICVIIYRFLRKSNIIKDYWSLAIFLLLFWCAATFSWIYRNGRPDTLNMLCVISFFTCYFEKRNKWLLVLFACLTAFSGIQGCPYLLGILACLYFFQPEKKRIKTALYMAVAGIAAGLILLSLCFFLQGHLLQFYYRCFILSSSTVRNAMLFITPYLQQIIPIDEVYITALLKPDTAVPTSFFEKIMTAYTINKEYLMLCLANGIVYVWLLFKRTIVFKSTESKFISITLIIPLIMTFAGRFAGYYTWMCYFPAVLCLIYIIGKHSRQTWIYAVYGLATLAVVSSGLPKTLITADKNAYKSVESFVLKQNFTNRDKIASSLPAYYIIRGITEECYFTGLYTLSLVPEDTKYVLTAKGDYGNEHTEAYLDLCKSAGKKVSAVDSLDSPQMTLYLVE